MLDGLTLEDLSTLAETVDVECKAAQGRHGLGEVPEDFWRSYSAMANGEGGVIWLGIQEKPRGVFRALGLTELEKVRKALWDNLHNRKQISVNLLTEQQVQPVCCGWKCHAQYVSSNPCIWETIRLAIRICVGMRAITQQTMKQCVVCWLNGWKIRAMNVC